MTKMCEKGFESSMQEQQPENTKKQVVNQVA
jgi:hypothetical protein